MKLEPRTYSGIETIRIPFLCTPVWTLLHMLIVLITRLCLLLQISATSDFVNKSLTVIKIEDKVISILWSVLILGILITWGRISEPLRLAVECKIENGLRKNFRTSITQKRAMMAYPNVENHTIWDLMLRVNREPEKMIIRGLSTIEGLGGIVIQAIGILSIVALNVWWVTLLSIIICIPMVIFSVKKGRAQYEADREVAKLERRYEDLSDVLLNRDSVDERALFSIIKQLSPRWIEYYQKVRRHRLVVEFRWYFKEKLSGIVVSLLTVVIALVLIGDVVEGTLSVGLYVALIQGVTQMIDIVTKSFSTYINDFTKTIEYFKDITIFANLPDTEDACALPEKIDFEFQKLEFKNVTFRYPGTEKKVLDNMSFIMNAGRHYAIVGANGAGKTTVTKLITGLYPEFEGEILINDKPLKEYSQSQLKALISIHFQDFARYSISLRDNVAIGDVSNMENKDMDERVLNALNQVGLDNMVKELEQGIYTPLGKLEKGGQDISGGQWQRVAMARMLISDATLRILDEPTAALDPISESAIYSEFDAISKNFTTIFISHRLGSIKLADEILVIDKGKVSEQGTHRELMEQGGIYAEMYDKQRSWYNG